MKVALLGGTGNLGKGLAIRLSRLGYEVIVGSRKLEKAEAKAKEYEEIAGVRITGLENAKAAEICDVVFFTIPWEHAFSTAEQLRDALKDKIVISPLVPMEKRGGVFVYVKPPEGSAAEKLASILRESKIVAAYHTIPAARFADLSEKLNWDVPMCGDDSEAKKVVAEMTERMGMRPLDAGPLRNSSLIEALTPLIMNIMARNRLGELGVRFV